MVWIFFVLLCGKWTRQTVYFIIIEMVAWIQFLEHKLLFLFRIVGKNKKKQQLSKCGEVIIYARAPDRQEYFFQCKNLLFEIYWSAINLEWVKMKYKHNVQHTSMRIDTYTYITSHHITSIGICLYAFRWYYFSPKFWSALFILLIKKKSFHYFCRADSVVSYSQFSILNIITVNASIISVHFQSSIHSTYATQLYLHSHSHSHSQLCTPLFAWVSVVRKINSHSIDFYFVLALYKYEEIYIRFGRESVATCKEKYCAFWIGKGAQCAYRKYILHCCVRVCAPYRERFEACNW